MTAIAGTTFIYPFIPLNYLRDINEIKIKAKSREGQE
jgi:hypothetical protein